MLADFAALTGTLADQKQSIGEIPQSLNAAVQDLRDSLSVFKSLAGDVKPQLIGSMDNLSKELTQMSQSSKSMATELEVVAREMKQESRDEAYQKIGPHRLLIEPRVSKEPLNIDQADMGQAFDYNLDGAVDMLNGSDDYGKWYLYANQGSQNTDRDNCYTDTYRFQIGCKKDEMTNNQNYQSNGNSVNKRK